MLTVSIGIAVYPRDAEAADALIAAADKALYADKHQGRNRCTAYSGSA
jgi:diguanylate cyclase (GGDEF)-like protein